MARKTTQAMFGESSQSGLTPRRPFLGLDLPEELHPSLINRILQLRLAGRDLSHTREANLKAIEQLMAGHHFYTLNLTVVEKLLSQGSLDSLEVLAQVASRTGCSRDPAITRGPNYINPRACLYGLWEAAQMLHHIRDIQGTVVFGSGHPGTMLGAYNRLADYLRSYGCSTPTAGAGAEVEQDWYLDFIGAVACVSDTCNVHHTHMTRAMEIFLEQLESPPDLAIADHGFAAACINRDIPCITAMDTNDPALAVAAEAGAEFILVPMNDNMPNQQMNGLADLYISLITLVDAQKTY
ncbi:MAG: phosphatase [Candidatus Sericytochromatia bacterium]|nr:phosphatase [Candidatus Sericytochromatia bacterium]